MRPSFIPLGLTCSLCAAAPQPSVFRVPAGLESEYRQAGKGDATRSECEN
jgi:hypothetical protein